MKETTARKAAKWWADHLRYGAKLDHGDKSDTGMMTMMLATIAQAQFTEEQAQAFEDALCQRLLAAEEWETRSIHVDYGPCLLLADAGAAAGLSFGISDLPWKTGMWIDEDTIKVACGYGAPIEELP